ncbi:MAG: 50S ribosomal protein L24 [Verrucomicrobia bacterium]|nr:50S ribosomal protein L24 [Verrucomicrobiota bacterium]
MSARLKIHVKKGDMVVAISGADSGKAGKVLQVMPKSDSAIVEGLNYVKKHMRKSQDNPNGGIIDREAPIHVSNLKKQDGGTQAKAPRKKVTKKGDGAK